MANKLSITNEEFACAIIASRPDRSSIGEFLQQLTTPGPKEKHDDWQRVCENIRQAKNIPTISRGWRKEAHGIFIENLGEIGKILWNKVMQLPLSQSHEADVFETVNAAIDRCHDRLAMRKMKRRK